MWTGGRTTTSFANHGLLMKHALSKGISRNLVHPALMEEEITSAALSMPIAKGAIRLNRSTSPRSLRLSQLSTWTICLQSYQPCSLRFFFEKIPQMRSRQRPRCMSAMLSTQYPRPSCDPCKLTPVNEQRKQHIADLYKIAYECITTERFHPQPGIQCSWCQYRMECSE